VRIPRIAWQAVLCDLPRYEVVYVQLEQPTPPPQYQAKDMATWGKDDKKQRPSSGLFSWIKKIVSG
jgi:hypothetical protein